MTQLTAFWITSLLRHAPLGFGVTAWSRDDAFAIIEAFGYGRFLPENLVEVTVVEGIKFAELDHVHVVNNMGPIAVRGLWYPFVAVGVPSWAEERIRSFAGRYPVK